MMINHLPNNSAFLKTAVLAFAFSPALGYSDKLASSEAFLFNPSADKYQEQSLYSDFDFSDVCEVGGETWQVTSLNISDLEIEKLCDTAGLNYFLVRGFIASAVRIFDEIGIDSKDIDVTSYLDPESQKLIVTASFFVSGSEELVEQSELLIADEYFDNPANFFFEILSV